MRYRRKYRRQPLLKPMQWIILVLIVGIVAFTATLLFNDNGQFVLHMEPKQEYVSATIDSTVAMRNLHPISPNCVVDSVHIPDFQSLKVNVNSNSDSLQHYNLYRHQQEVVTIDLEEHKEEVFFTWSDIKAYFDGIVLTFEQLKNKIYNDNH